MTADVTPEMLAANPLDDVVLDKRLAVRLFAALHPSVSDASRAALRSQLAPVLVRQSAHLAALPAPPAAQAGDALPPMTPEEVRKLSEANGEIFGADWPAKFWEHAAQLVNAALAARGQAGEREAWIPVSERLPADGENVVAWLDGAPEIVGYRKSPTNDGMNWACGGFIHDERVTHWMPLPAAPRGAA